VRAIIATVIIFFIWGCASEDKTVTPAPPDDTGDTTAPIIMSTCPADGDTGVDVSSCIYCTFSEPIDTTCIARWSFYLDQDISGHFSCDSCIAGFDPAYNLDYGRTYIVTITKGVKDTAGNCLANEYCWSFTTTFAPQIISVSPLDGDSNVPLDAVITATFSKTMDASTITTSSFMLGNGVAGTVVYHDSTATFIPDDSLDYNRIYTATLTKLITDTDGNPLESNYSWSFAVVNVPLMPLAVGNQWAYKIEKYDAAGNQTDVSYDLTRISHIRDTVGLVWYGDNHSQYYCNREDGLWRIGVFDHPYLFAQFPGNAHTGYGGDPGWVYFGLVEHIIIEETRCPVTVEAGSFSCYKYCSYMGDRFRFYHYYAPGVGLVLYEIYQFMPLKSWPILIERRSLFGYDLIDDPDVLY
jgi:hypothetical protein